MLTIPTKCLQHYGPISAFHSTIILDEVIKVHIEIETKKGSGSRKNQKAAKHGSNMQINYQSVKLKNLEVLSI